MASRARRYPLPMIHRVDRSGAIRASTLEFFAGHAGWHTAKELLKDTVRERNFLLERGNRAVQMRLRRYHGQRLLDRRRRSREYEYAITTVGKERLVYLWEKLGYLDPWKPSTELELKLTKLRLEAAEDILAELSFALKKKQITDEASYHDQFLRDRSAHSSQLR